MSSLESFMERIEQRLARLEVKLGAVDDSPVDSQAVSPKVVAFNELVASLVDPFVSTSAGLNEDLGNAASALKDAFVQLGSLISASTKSKRPSDAQLKESFAPIQESLKKVSASQTRKTPLEFNNHFKAIGEGLQILVFPMVGPAPASFVESFVDASVFWANKVRMEFKNAEGGETHVNWCTQLNAIWKGMHEYVSKEFKMNLDWNPKGVDFTGLAASAAPSASPKAAPASAPAAPKATPAPAAAGPAGGLSNVFAELSKIDQSGGKTAGLRHVSKDMKSKNQKARPPPPVLPKSGPRPSAMAPPMKDPVLKLAGNKWMVEFQKDMVTLEEDQVNIKQTIYIYGCVGATIVIKNKCNSITIDNCKKTKVLFDQAIGVCEVVNSKSVQLQVTKRVPTISIDKTDGVFVYLSKETLHETRFVTSKSSEMNVSFPGDTPDGAYVEKPIPEQFVHQILEDHSISSDVSELYKVG